MKYSLEKNEDGVEIIMVKKSANDSRRRLTNFKMLVSQ